MSVFHPYGGGIGGGLRPNPETDGTSPGDSLTLKVRDIRLNISRTVQTNIVGQPQQQQQQSGSQASQLASSHQPHSSTSSMTTSSATNADVRAATATMTSYITASSGANSVSLHNIVRFSGKLQTCKLTLVLSKKLNHFASL